MHVFHFIRVFFGTHWVPFIHPVSKYRRLDKYTYLYENQYDTRHGIVDIHYNRNRAYIERFRQSRRGETEKRES